MEGSCLESPVTAYIQRQQREAEQIRQYLGQDALTEQIMQSYAQGDPYKYNSIYFNDAISEIDKSLKQYTEQIYAYDKKILKEIQKDSFYALRDISLWYDEAQKSICSVGYSAIGLYERYIEQSKRLNNSIFSIDSIKDSLLREYATHSLQDDISKLNAEFTAPVNSWIKEQQEYAERIYRSFLGTGLTHAYYEIFNEVTQSSAYSSLLGNFATLSEYLAENPLTRSEWDVAVEQVDGYAGDPNSIAKLFQETVNFSASLNISNLRTSRGNPPRKK